MNSRQRRKRAAQEHNDRIGLMLELKELQSAIYAKHRVRARPVIISDNSSILMEIARLRGILESDTPPPRSKPGKSGLSLAAAVAVLSAMGLSNVRS